MLKQGDVIDYTTRKRELPAKRLFRCPECGKIGERSEYRNGDAGYTHRKRLRSWFWDVLDFCYIKGER